MAIIQQCKDMIATQHDRGVFVMREQARGLLENYLVLEGIPQPPRDAGDHVYGHLLGLNCIRQLLLKIDQHNAITMDLMQQFTAIRIYRACTADGKNDVVIVPVKRDGQDYPKGLTEAMVDSEMYLTGSGPCPNICKALYFNT